MPMQLRKRKAPEVPAPAPAPAPTTKRSAKNGKVKAPAARGRKKAEPKKVVEKAVEEEVKEDAEEAKAEEKTKEDADKAVDDETEDENEEPKPKKKKSGDKAEVGDFVDLDGFGGEIATNDGEKTTLKKLVDESKAGVVLFTYPKASTPGCTKQVCFFRDAYKDLTVSGLAIYGLSADSPKANTTFKDKQKLQYPLLCDPKQTLIGAIGLKKAPKGTQRGVFVISKDGEVLVAEPGSPQGTADRVAALVEELKK